MSQQSKRDWKRWQIETISLSKQQWITQESNDKKVPVWLKLEEDPFAIRVFIKNSPTNIKRVGGKEKIKEAQLSIKNMPSDFIEMVVEIEKFSLTTVKFSSYGAWSVGKIIDEFLKKYPEVAIQNLFVILKDYFGPRLFTPTFQDKVVTSDKRIWWKSIYMFYKVYDLEDVNNVDVKWFFEEVTHLGNGKVLFRTLNALNIHKQALEIHKDLSKKSRVQDTRKEVAKLVNDTILEKKKSGALDRKGELIIKRDERDSSKYETGSVCYSVPGDRS